MDQFPLNHNKIIKQQGFEHQPAHQTLRSPGAMIWRDSVLHLAGWRAWVLKWWTARSSQIDWGNQWYPNFWGNIWSFFPRTWKFTCSARKVIFTCTPAIVDCQRSDSSIKSSAKGSSSWSSPRREKKMVALPLVWCLLRRRHLIWLPYFFTASPFCLCHVRPAAQGTCKCLKLSFKLQAAMAPGFMAYICIHHHHHQQHHHCWNHHDQWVLWCSSKLNLKDKGNKDAQKRRTLKSKDSHNVIFSHLLNIYQPTPHAPHLAHGMTTLLRALLCPFLQLRPDDLHFRCCLADFMGRSWPWLTWDTLRKHWGSVKLHIYSKGLNRSSHPSLTQMTNIQDFGSLQSFWMTRSWDIRIHQFRSQSAKCFMGLAQSGAF